MKKLNTIRIMALGLAACALTSAAELVGEPDKIFDYTGTYKRYDYDKERVVSEKLQGYIIFGQYDIPLAKVLYWREGSNKFIWIDYSEYDMKKIASGAASSQKGEEDEPFGLTYLDDAGKTANFWSFDELVGVANGFGTARRARRDGQLNSLTVSGTTCEPENSNGTFRLRFNKSLTSKAAKSDLNALEYVTQELMRKGYRYAML
jgi:hypothetical protein